MAAKRVLLLSPMLAPVGMEMLRREVDVVEGWRLDPAGRAAELARAHGLGGGGSADDIAAAPALEVIASYGSGYEHIDVEAATAAGIAVVNAAGAQTSAVAEHGIGLMLALAKRIAYADRLMHARSEFIDRQTFTGEAWPGWPTQLSGKTLGVIGYGFIGRDLAEKCRVAFDMQVLVYSPRFDPDEATRQRVTKVEDLLELLSRSDYVSLSVPLTSETRAMIGEAQLRAMKPGAVLVNLSRGATVDTGALVESLRSGHLGGAALDVFDPEPLPGGHPLYGFDNVVLTPHIGGWVIDSFPALARTAAREILCVLQGRRPSRLVNPQVWPMRRSGVARPDVGPGGVSQ